MKANAIKETKTAKTKVKTKFPWLDPNPDREIGACIRDNSLKVLSFSSVFEPIVDNLGQSPAGNEI